MAGGCESSSLLSATTLVSLIADAVDASSLPPPPVIVVAVVGLSPLAAVGARVAAERSRRAPRRGFLASGAAVASSSSPPPPPPAPTIERVRTTFARSSAGCVLADAVMTTAAGRATAFLALAADFALAFGAREAFCALRAVSLQAFKLCHRSETFVSRAKRTQVRASAALRAVAFESTCYISTSLARCSLRPRRRSSAQRRHNR